MDRGAMRLPLLAVVTLLAAAFIALPGMALADEDAGEAAPAATGQAALSDEVPESGGATDAGSAAPAKQDETQGQASGSAAQSAQGDAVAGTSDTPTTGGSAAGDDAGTSGEGAGGAPEGAVNDDPQAGSTPGATGAETGATTEGGSATQGSATTGSVGGESASGTVNATENATEPGATTTPTTAATAENATSTAATTATTVLAPAAKTTAKKVKKTGRVLANGYYIISNGKKLRLVVTYKSKKKGSNVYVLTDSNAKKQRWYLSWSKKYKAYFIRNAKSKYYLTVADGNKKSGTNVLQWSTKKVSKKARLWTFTLTSDGSYVIKSKLGSVVLDLNNGKKLKNKANVDVRKAKKSGGTTVAYQRWFILPFTPSVAKSTARVADGKLYKISFANTSASQVLNAVGQSAGGNVNTATKSSSASQNWAISSDGDGYYHVINVNSGKALAVYGGQHTATTNVVQAGMSNNAAQKWAVKANADGTITFVSKATGMALDLAGNSNGANARTYFYNESTSPLASQKFRYSEVALDSALPSYSGVRYVANAATDTRVLTVPGNSTSAGTQLVTATKTSSAAYSQKYQLSGNNTSGYTIQSVISGKYVTQSGSKVVQSAATGEDTQLWIPSWDFKARGIVLTNASTGQKLNLSATVNAKATASSSSVPAVTLVSTAFIDNGTTYHLINGAQSSTNYVAAPTSASTAAGATVTLYSPTPYGKDQKFKITNLGNNTYRITNYASGKNLMVNSSGKVVQGTSTGNDAKWVASIAPNGGLLLKNAKTGKYLNATTNRSSAVTQSTATGTGAQWYVESTTVLKKYQELAYAKVLKRGAKFKQNYYLVADIGKGRMMIWQRANKKSVWTIKYDYKISYGRIVNGKSKTPLKDSKIYSHKRWLDSAGTWNGYWSAPYALRWSWAYFHGFTHYYKHKSGVIDKRLGKALSNGCIRMEEKYAKWMYKNFKSLKGCGVTVWKNGHY